MFKRIKRTSLVLGIALTVILGMSYGTFIFTTNSYRSTEMLVGNLTYGIEITSTGGSETINGTSVSLTSGKTSTVLLKITSLNKIISKYGIDYKMSSGTGSVKYASNTGWLPTGKINENNVGTYEKVIKVVISATTDVTVDFTVTGGYSNNDLIEVKDGYTRLTEIYDGIVDYKENLKTIISKETTNNIYGGEAINNYLQYPTNTDTTKNIWRVLGYYNSVDGIKAVSNQASTTTESNISSSLTSFYNTLEKQEDFILETNKFNCTNTTCTTSSYSNIGLLSTSEYNMLGGVNSYLASNESYFALDNSTINNITSSGITDTTTSTTSGLRAAVYLQNDVKVTGSGTSSDPYRLSDKGDVIFASATLNGTALETFPKESDPYIPKTVTCTNGSVGHWNTEKQKIELTTVNLPTSCVVDFTEGYTVTLSAVNGTVTAPTSKVIGRTGTATFTVTPNEDYIYESDTCGGTLRGKTYTISNVTSNKTCSIIFKKYTLYERLLIDNPTIKTRTDFSSVFTEANTGTLYKSTESISGGESTNVYYFAGDARNNWVRFGEWQEDIYLFKTTRTTSNGYIEGMYTQTLEECNNLNLGSCNKIVIASKGDPIYWRIIRTNKDGSVRLLYSGAKPDTEVGFIDNTCWYKNSKGECLTNSENYLYYTFDDSESEIKKSVEKWYSTNLINYDNYISKNAIYCDDKDYKIFEISVVKEFNSFIRVSGLSGQNPTTWDSIYNGKILPSFNCSSIESQYTSKFSNFGNKQLNYPIGLITADEISFIGGRFGENNTISWFYKNSVNGPIIKDNPWWTMSSAGWNSANSYSMALYLNGLLHGPNVQEKKGIRPVISIKGDNIWKSGDGRATNPYEIR